MQIVVEILPLAITMMAGPQIISAVMLVTGKYAVKSSLAFVGAVGLAASLGTLALMVLLKLLGVDSLDEGGRSPIAKVVETILVGLLVFLAVKTYLGRAGAKPPKWMGSLQEMEPKEAFKLGMTLILAMPSDIVIMITVAVHLISRGAPFLDALPFIITTVFVAALPLMLYTLFHKRAVVAMPGIRQWMDGNNWLIQIAVYLIFIVLLWK